MQFTVPLQIKVSKNKHFILNLNNYRNAHHRVLSSAKRNFDDMFMSMRLPDYRKFNKIRVVYKIYPKSNRSYDGNNVASIIDKFLMDSMVKRGIIPDDNINHVAAYDWIPMAPDRDNPRCEVEIIDISSEKG